MDDHQVGLQQRVQLALRAGRGGERLEQPRQRDQREHPAVHDPDFERRGAAVTGHEPGHDGEYRCPQQQRSGSAAPYGGDPVEQRQSVTAKTSDEVEGGGVEDEGTDQEGERGNLRG